jgi:long-subunit fatty acid transport protein
MGSAFIGLADDATASEFNPAGLRILRRPELALQWSFTEDRHTEWLPNSSPPYPGEPIRDEFTDTYNSFSFAAATFPMQKLVLSISQLTPVYFDRYFIDPMEMEGEYFFRHQEVFLRNYGISAAYALTPELYIGVTGKYGIFEYNESGTTADDSLEDYTLGANLGLLWRLHPWFTLGAVYKTEQEIEGTFEGQDVKLQIPRTVGTGLAFHPNDKLRILGDIDYIEWSEFDDSLSGLENYERQDVTRYHLGCEYLLGIVKDSAIFLRGGYMLEESNDRYYSGEDSIFSEYFEKISPEPDDVEHYTMGFGIAREWFQLDFAFDYSDKTTEYIISTVIYF